MKRKRDMNLVRKIVFKIVELEEEGKLPIDYSKISVEGYNRLAINEHLSCLEDVGILNLSKEATESGIKVKILKLNPTKRKFVELLRDEERWEKAKSLLKERGLEPIFIVMKNIIMELE